MTMHFGENKPKVAAVIAAYNEEVTIALVVKTIADSKLFDEILVISDGSTDGTAQVARQAGATLVHELPVKNGKGAAVLHGVAHTDAPVIFLADADLIGLRREHLEAILNPVLEGKLVMCVGWRDRGPFYQWVARYLPIIGGERALTRHVIENINPKYLQGFMIESALNYHCRADGLPYNAVYCTGLHIRRKLEKVGFWRSVPQYLHMAYEIVKAMIIVRIAHLRGELKK